MILLSVIALASCAAVTDPTTTIVTAETAFAGAVAAEVVYLQSGKADPAIVKQIEVYRLQVDKVLSPLAQAAGTGTPPSSENVLAAQTAVNLLVQYLAENKIGSN